MKISIIGTGIVGSTLAYALVLKGLCNHLLLANRTVDKAQGDALDLQHCLPFCERTMRIEFDSIDNVRASDIVVMCASVPLSDTMQARMDLGPANTDLFKQIIPSLAQHNPDAIFIIITNPVDIMTYLVNQITDLPSNRIMGVGTLIDSARFRALLSAEQKIHPDDLRAYILGEHGPHQFPVFSHAFAGSEQIVDNEAHRKLFQEVSNAGFDVYHYKGYTNYAIASATCEVIQSIVYDDHRTMPLSTFFHEWQGIRDNCFSIPVVVGRSGVIRYLNPELNEIEHQALEKTAARIKTCINQLLNTNDSI